MLKKLIPSKSQRRVASLKISDSNANNHKRILEVVQNVAILNNLLNFYVVKPPKIKKQKVKNWQAELKKLEHLKKQAAENSRKIVNNAIIDGKRIKNQIIDEAQVEFDEQTKQLQEKNRLAIVNNRQQIEEQMKQSQEEIRKAIVSVAQQLASKVLKREVKMSDHQALVNDFLKSFDIIEEINNPKRKF